MNKIIKNALILAAITLIAGLLLGAAHQVTLEPIQKQQEKERRFRTAWVAEVDRLKIWESIYQRAIEEKIFPPMSDRRAFTIEELQKVSYKLDMLCIQGSRREQEAILIAEGWKL